MVHFLVNKHRLVRHIRLKVLNEVLSFRELARWRLYESSRSLSAIKQLKRTNLSADQILASFFTESDDGKSFKAKLHFRLIDQLVKSLSDSFIHLPGSRLASHRVGNSS